MSQNDSPRSIMVAIPYVEEGLALEGAESFMELSLENFKEKITTYPIKKFTKTLSKANKVTVTRLMRNLGAFVESAGEVVNSLPSDCGEYAVDSLTFSLGIDLEGHVALLGQGGSGHFDSAITLTLKKKNVAAKSRST